MYRSFVLLLLVALPLGCARLTDPAEVAAGRDLLSVDRARYAPGDTALVRLANGTGQPLGYNLCMSARELWTGSEWRRIEPLRMCMRVLHLLEVGEETVQPEPITAEWEAGRYRMVTTVELIDDGERLEAFSRPFEVEAR